MSKYKFILFDADGVLFDFEKAERTSLLNTLEYFSIEPEPNILETYRIENLKIWAEFEKGLISAGNLRPERFSRFLKSLKIEKSALEMSVFYIEKLKKMTFLIPNALEIVEYCSKKAKLAIITNGLSDVQNSRISLSKLNKYFHHIFISEEIGYPKPDHRIFDFVFNMIKFAKNDTIIIGDSLKSDIKGGNDYGIDTCWVNLNNEINKTNIIPTFEIKSLQELKEII